MNKININGKNIKMKVYMCVCPVCGYHQEGFTYSSVEPKYLCIKCTYDFKEEAFYKLDGKTVPGNGWIEEEVDGIKCPECSTKISKTPDNRICCGEHHGQYMCYKCLTILSKIDERSK